jgi:hypothetical protein
VGEVIRLRLDEAKSKQGHGTRACYILGCRRADCVAANTAYQRRYRANLAGTEINAHHPSRRR